MYVATPEAAEFAAVLARAAGTEVAEHADAPELIAVGRGPDAERLLRGATCPVLVVPAGARTRVNTVGAAFDGRPRSRPALNTAIALAGQLQADLLVLGVHRPSLGADASRDDFEYMLGRVSFSTHGGSDHRLLTGRPGPALADASVGVELLVVGSAAHGALREVVFGSVTRHLAEHAACPVLVVPKPPDRP